MSDLHDMIDRIRTPQIGGAITEEVRKLEQQLASAQAERDAYERELTTIAAQLQDVLEIGKVKAVGLRETAAGVRELSEELVAAREDSARLDWLEAHPLKTEVVGGAQDGAESKAWAIACHAKWTLREAIDAARAAGGGDG